MDAQHRREGVQPVNRGGMYAAFEGADVRSTANIREILLAKSVLGPVPAEDLTKSFFQFHLLNPQKER